jgi:hypothetical protein
MRVIVCFNFRGDSDSPQRFRDVFPAVEQLRAPNKLGHGRAYNQLMVPKPPENAPPAFALQGTRREPSARRTGAPHPA